VQYALSKGVDVIVAAGNDNQNLDDPKFDSTSPNNLTYANVIQNRPVDLVSKLAVAQAMNKGSPLDCCMCSVTRLRMTPLPQPAAWCHSDLSS
jgi:hypothetical protein